jgi:hypothetical protein
MAIVLVLIFGVLAIALATYAVTSLRYGRAVRLSTDLRASAESGLRYGLAEMTYQPEGLCDTPNDLVGINGHTVSLECEILAGTESDSSPFAAVLTDLGSGPRLVTPSGQNPWIDGAVYLARENPAAGDFQLASTLTISDGDLYYPGTDCSSPPAIPGLPLVMHPAAVRGWNCLDREWIDLAPTPEVPTHPSDTETAKLNPAYFQQPAGEDPTCRVFFPGVYTAPPEIDQAGENLFMGGDYYFEFDDAVVIDGDVLGGQPEPTSTDTAGLQGVAPSCVQYLADLAAQDPPVISGGVTWYFGKGAKVEVTNGGRLEMYGRPHDVNPTFFVSMQTINFGNACGDAPDDPDHPAGLDGYCASTLEAGQAGPAGDPILSIMGTGSAAVHGMIYTPQARVDFGSVQPGQNAQALGGVVAASIALNGSAPAGGFVISGPHQPSVTKVALTATASEGTASRKVRAIFDHESSRALSETDYSIIATGCSPPTLDFHTNPGIVTTLDEGSLVVAAGLPAGTRVGAVDEGLARADLQLPSGQCYNPNLERPIFVIATPRIAINSWRQVE